MNAAQRRLYFTQLWPMACKTNGWDLKDTERRHEVTRYVSGKESASDLTQFEITKLFNYLKHIARPDSLNHAIPVANPELAQDSHERKIQLFAIRKFGFTDFYIQKCAEHKCKAHGCSKWIDLPIAELEKLKWTIKARAQVKKSPQSKETCENPF